MKGLYNPVRVLLLMAETGSQGMEYADIAIEYCFQQAEADKDIRRLLPVMQCLGLLVDPSYAYCDCSSGKTQPAYSTNARIPYCSWVAIDELGSFNVTPDPKSPCESQSWIKKFFDIVQFKRKLTYTAPVKTHDFHLDMLDNPAIAALIEYK
ncbi:hypothetical protein BGZ72_002068, partial [Mortierella alpina]